MTAVMVIPPEGAILNRGLSPNRTESRVGDRAGARRAAARDNAVLRSALNARVRSGGGGMREIGVTLRQPLGQRATSAAPPPLASATTERPFPTKIEERPFVRAKATRTRAEAKIDNKSGKEAARMFTRAQLLTPGAMSLSAAQRILQRSFGGLKKIVPGAVEVLENQRACARKYDEVCMKAHFKREDGADWKPGDCDRDDRAAGVKTEGFAWRGVVYVNGATPLVTATAHEILHNNATPRFREKMGEALNEGVTETLARQAIRDAGIKVPTVTAYPKEVRLATALMERLGKDTVRKGYFLDVNAMLSAFRTKSKASWGAVVGAANKLNVERVKQLLRAKQSR